MDRTGFAWDGSYECLTEEQRYIFQSYLIRMYKAFVDYVNRFGLNGKSEQEIIGELTGAYTDTSFQIDKHSILLMLPRINATVKIKR